MKKLKHIAMGLFLMLMLLSAASVQAALPTPTLAKLVSAQATGCASVRITWEKAENAFYYRVYGMVDGKYVGLGVTQGTSMEVKSSETMPLIPGKTYQFTVRSYNRNADKTEVVMGPYDRNGLKVTLPKPDLPAVGNLTATSLDYNKNKISWDPVPGAQGYRVYYRKDGKLVGLVKGPATSYTHV
ncbi:MAG: fibronectin type III domain-containing protein, partial [Clostridiales bacterium]|nr:fibronectin type III domain-containing protein [Candidatus Blautia equi]